MADLYTALRTAKVRYTDLLEAGYLLDALRQDVRTGLIRTDKQLPPTWFYDDLGSELFEQITTRCAEYYPTRVEDGILRRRAAQIAGITGARTVLELGSGASVKTRRILDALGPRLHTLISIDVCDTALLGAAGQLAEHYPDVQLHAVRADYTTPISLGEIHSPHPRLFLFLGSTIGNFEPEARAAFLSRLAAGMMPGDYLLLGADLAKDPRILRAAYDDSQGITARFNLNVLRRLNRELGADFDLRAFEHHALWNAGEQRIEMRLRSLRRQTVTIPGCDLTVTFARGEELLTEISCKAQPHTIRGELARAGLYVTRLWIDQEHPYAVVLARPLHTGTPHRPAPGPRTAPP
jgi:L-histidine N-alpha-methyltransferase